MFYRAYIFQDEGERTTDQVCLYTLGPFMFRILKDTARWRVASGEIGKEACQGL